MMEKRVTKLIPLFILVFFLSLAVIPLIEAQNGGPISQPDIKVENIGFSDEEPMEDDNITINATVRNNSTIPIQNATLVFLVNGQEIGNISDIALASDGSETYETSWKTEPGIHNVTAVLKIDGTLIRDSAASKELVVDPKPVGDVSTLLISLGVIALLVLVTSLLYSIVQAIRM